MHPIFYIRFNFAVVFRNEQSMYPLMIDDISID